MRPVWRIEIADGADISAAIGDRLLSLSVVDEAGLTSDRLTLKLDARPGANGARLALPDVGLRLTVSLGYAGAGLVTVGTYIVDGVTLKSAPRTLEISAKGANMPSAFRTPTTRAWDQVTLGEITRTIAGEHGMQARIAEDLDGIPFAHVDQVAESPMAFLSRLAAAHDAVVKPADTRLVLAPRGQAKAVSGQDLPVVRLPEAEWTQWSFKYSARKDKGQATGSTGVGGPGGTTVSWWDHDSAELREETAGEPPYENAPYAEPTQARAVARAAARKNEGDRGKAAFTGKLPGRPGLQAEQKMVLPDFGPGVPTDWRLERLEHTLDGGGFVTSVKAELFQPDQKKVEADSLALWDFGF